MVQIKQTRGFCNRYSFINFTFKKICFYFNVNLGQDTNELIISPALFQNNSAIIFWKIELEITLNYVATGVSSLVFKVNQLPSNGSCTVSPTSGQILTTLFQITCTNWADPDGSIERYEYFGK